MLANNYDRNKNVTLQGQYCATPCPATEVSFFAGFVNPLNIVRTAEPWWRIIILYIYLLRVRVQAWVNGKGPNFRGTDHEQYAQLDPAGRVPETVRGGHPAQHGGGPASTRRGGRARAQAAQAPPALA